MSKTGVFVTNEIKAIGLSLAALATFGLSSSEAIILARTGDPNANTTVPTNDPAGSGWNYEAQWGGFLGTPISPQFFLAAAHIGGSVGDSITYGGTAYATVARFSDPFSDLLIWQISGTFPTYAPMYSKNDEVGQRIVAIGKGTQRGTEFFDGTGVSRGWNWGPSDGRQRWGENIVSTIVADPDGPRDYLYATFDRNGLTDECHFSSGDSSGAVFINDGGVWKLAGINYGVDGYFYTDNSGHGQFIAALFNVGGFYFSEMGNGQPPFLLYPDPSPTGIYPTRISSKLPWIESVIDPNGMANNDGIPNLLEYAKTLNDAPPSGYGLASAQAAPPGISMTYRKLTDKPALQYQLQQSVDLIHWEPAASQDSTVATQGNVTTIKSTVSGSSPLFLKLQVTQP